MTKARRILEELGLLLVASDDAWQMLKLKGGGQVAFWSRQGRASPRSGSRSDFSMPRVER